MKSYKLLYSSWSLPSLLFKFESVLHTLSVWVQRERERERERERASPGLDEGWTSLGTFRGRGNKLYEERIGF